MQPNPPIYNNPDKNGQKNLQTFAPPPSSLLLKFWASIPLSSPHRLSTELGYYVALEVGT